MLGRQLTERRAKALAQLRLIGRAELRVLGRGDVLPRIAGHDPALRRLVEHIKPRVPAAIEAVKASDWGPADALNVELNRILTTGAEAPTTMGIDIHADSAWGDLTMAITGGWDVPDRIDDPALVDG